jgi:hypothetical protein
MPSKNDPLRENGKFLEEGLMATNRASSANREKLVHISQVHFSIF